MTSRFPQSGSSSPQGNALNTAISGPAPNSSSKYMTPLPTKQPLVSGAPKTGINTSKPTGGLLAGRSGSVTTAGGGFAGNPADNPNYNSQLNDIKTKALGIQSQLNSGTTTPPIVPSVTGVPNTSTPPSPPPTGGTTGTPPVTNPSPNLGWYGQHVNKLADMSNQPGAAYSDAQRNYQGAVQDLKNFDLRTNQAVSGEYQKAIPLNFQQGRAQVIQNQAASDRAALGSAVTGASNALGAANTQQDMQQNALGTAIGAGAPQAQTPGTSVWDPISGTWKNQFIGGDQGGGQTLDSIVDRIGSGGQGYTEGIATARSLGIPEEVIRNKLQQKHPGFNQTTSDQIQATRGALGNEYSIGATKLNAADKIGTQIQSDLRSNPSLNQESLTFMTNFNKILSGQTGNPAQQRLALQVKQYLDALGVDPNIVTNLAGQQRGSLGSLLNSVYDTEKAKNDAKKPSDGGASSGSTGGSSIQRNPNGTLKSVSF